MLQRIYTHRLRKRERALTFASCKRWRTLGVSPLSTDIRYCLSSLVSSASCRTRPPPSRSPHSSARSTQTSGMACGSVPAAGWNWTYFRHKWSIYAVPVNPRAAIQGVGTSTDSSTDMKLLQYIMDKKRQRVAGFLDHI